MMKPMPTETLERRIEITPGVVSGKPHIAGHRITVQNVAIWHEWLGHTTDEIATEYDLTLADVHAALATTMPIRRRSTGRSVKASALPKPCALARPLSWRGSPPDPAHG